MINVTVIIPNYNHSHYLEEAIQSVLCQSYPAFEIIVVDDGSTDCCGEVVSRFKKSVRYIWQENRGLAGARNTGIYAAQGEWIGLLDADDCWQPGYLASMVDLIQTHPQAAVFYCQTRCMDECGAELPQVLGGPVISPEAMRSTLIRANFLIPSTILMRRAIVLEAGLFDQQLRSCEDWDLWLRLLPEQRFIGHSAVLGRYRQHGLSLSKNLDGMHRAAQAVVEKHFGLDDGRFQQWPLEKRRAYGGLYQYQLLTHIQRNNDWERAESCLCRALQADPTLATHPGLFYDLALGNQPVGYRGTSQYLNLADNAQKIQVLLDNTFRSGRSSIQRLRPLAWGTAYFALGMVANHTGQPGLSRSFYWRALRHRPNLWRNRLVIGAFLKPLLSQKRRQKIS
ncbi:MAG: glycosyltransferase [Ardenticatenaceae bacterium]|nr:glycosyltransferase [Ardenticatenaceae bacterium]